MPLSPDDLAKDPATQWTDRVETVTLDVVKAVVSESVPGAITLHNLQLKATLLPHVDRLVLQLEQAIAALPGERYQQTIRYPADWWQAVRARWCPAWWLARSPVREHVEVIDLPRYGNLCPHLPIDAQHRHLTFVMQQPLRGVGEKTHPPPDHLPLHHLSAESLLQRYYEDFARMQRQESRHNGASTEGSDGTPR